LGLEEVVSVLLAGGLALVALERDALVVAPEVGGVVVVGVALAVVAEEQVEAVARRVTGRTGRPEAPLAHRPGGVAEASEGGGQGDGVGGQRVLALGLHLAVVADGGVAGVLAGHEHAARGSADRRAGVVLREAHPLLRHAVEVRGAYLLLAVAADLAV